MMMVNIGFMSMLMTMAVPQVFLYWLFY